jgi:Holliday junction resolvase RusA-like endonuclease
VKRYTVTLPEPPSANRWWRTTIIPAKGKRPATVNTYLSKEAREYKERIGRASAALIIAEGPVALRIDWYRGREAGDLDKRLGVALDAMQGVFYRNDDQVVTIAARRFLDRANPRLVVTVQSVDPALSLFAESGTETIGDVLAHLVEIAGHFRGEHPGDDGGYMVQVDEAIAAGKRVLSAL